jgi:hypothetical protein
VGIGRREAVIKIEDAVQLTFTFDSPGPKLKYPSDSLCAVSRQRVGRATETVNDAGALDPHAAWLFGTHRWVWGFTGL